MKEIVKELVKKEVSSGKTISIAKKASGSDGETGRVNKKTIRAGKKTVGASKKLKKEAVAV